MSWESVADVLGHPPRDRNGKKTLPAAWRVLVVLAHRADAKTRTCYPSIATIAREADISERSAHEAIRALRDAGRIDVRVNAGPPVRGGDQTRRPNLYRVLPVVEQGGKDLPTVSREPAEAKPANPGRTMGGKTTRPWVAKQRGPWVAKPATLTVRVNHQQPRDHNTPSERLAQHCADALSRREGHKPRVTAQWLDAAKTILAKHDYGCAEGLVTWATEDPKWRSRRLPDLAQNLSTAEYYRHEATNAMCYCWRVRYT